MNHPTLDEQLQITIVTTGGTIDKGYSPQPGTYNFDVGDPAVARILARVPVNFEYTIVPATRKDSLDLTDEDRMRIYEACRQAQSRRVLVSHGTDTLTQTARELSRLEDRVIVLFGAGQPERFKDSDASFNAGVAVGAVQLLPSGVYIAMSGRVYPWDRCHKSEDGSFVGQ